MISALLNRLGSAIRYLGWMDLPWKWRIVRGGCPWCGSRRFLVLGPTAFHTRCLGCRANVVTLGVASMVERHFRGDFAGKSAYELSSYGATFSFLERSFPHFSFSEYMPGRIAGETYDGIRNEDVQRLTFPDESFDVVTSNQVFEHVPDDLRAYRECHRVLVSGGALIFTVPLYDTASTIQLAELADDGAIRWLGAPEYHDSRLGGPRSAPTFWRHSPRDIPDRVRTAGFTHVSLESVEICHDRPDLAVSVIYAIK